GRRAVAPGAGATRRTPPVRPRGAPARRGRSGTARASRRRGGSGRPRPRACPPARGTCSRGGRSAPPCRGPRRARAHGPGRSGSRGSGRSRAPPARGAGRGAAARGARRPGRARAPARCPRRSGRLRPGGPRGGGGAGPAAAPVPPSGRRVDAHVASSVGGWRRTIAPARRCLSRADNVLRAAVTGAARPVCDPSPIPPHGTPMTTTTPLVWEATIALIIGLLAFDYFFHVRKAHAPSLREAAVWSAMYVGFALLFGAAVWTWGGADMGAEYFSGYITEKALSIDNVFVFLVIMSSFRVPREDQQKVLLFGIT